MKSPLKSKTVWMNSIMLVIALAEFLLGDGAGLLSGILGVEPSQLVPILLLVTGLGNIILRFVTDKPIRASSNGIRTLGILALVPFLAVSASCNDKEKAWYLALKTDQVLYEQLTEEIGDRYRAGEISDQRFDVLIDIGERWGSAHNAAVSALLVYHHSKNQATESTVLEALLEASSVLAELRRAWVREGESP